MSQTFFCVVKMLVYIPENAVNKALTNYVPKRAPATQVNRLPTIQVSIFSETKNIFQKSKCY